MKNWCIYVEKILKDYPLQKKLVEKYSETLEISQNGLAFCLEQKPFEKTCARPEWEAIYYTNLDQQVLRCQWYVAAIEDALTQLTPAEKKLVELRYFTPGKISTEMTAQKLFISRSEFYRQRQNALSKIALRLGIEIVEKKQRVVGLNK